jgi:hypothetical protein
MFNPKHTMSELCSTSNTQCRNSVQPQTHNVGIMFNTNIQCRNFVQPQTHNVETMFNPKHNVGTTFQPQTQCRNYVQPKTQNVGTMFNREQCQSSVQPTYILSKCSSTQNTYYRYSIQPKLTISELDHLHYIQNIRLI